MFENVARFQVWLISEPETVVKFMEGAMAEPETVLEFIKRHSPSLKLGQAGHRA